MRHRSATLGFISALCLSGAAHAYPITYDLTYGGYGYASTADGQGRITFDSSQVGEQFTYPTDFYFDITITPFDGSTPSLFHFVNVGFNEFLVRPDGDSYDIMVGASAGVTDYSFPTFGFTTYGDFGPASTFSGYPDPQFECLTTLGTVFQTRVDPTPEPSALSLLGLGLFAAAVWKHRRFTHAV